MKVLTLSLSILLLGATISAQTNATYSPSYALGQVNSNNIFPFATGSIRYMQIHDPWTFTSTNPAIIRGVRYRPSNQSSYVNRAGGTVEVMIRIGLAANGVTSQTPNTTFDNNFDSASVKTVVKRVKVNYPASGLTPADLKVFDIAFPFDSGALLIFQTFGNRSLVIETRQYSRSGGYPFDFVSNLAVTGSGYSLQNGPYAGCKNQAGRVVEHDSTPSQIAVGSANATFVGRSFVSTIPAIMTLGSQAVNVTLPGTSCNITNDLGLLVPGVTDSSGNFNVSFPVPNDSKLHRVRFFTQMVFLQSTANPVGIITSRGLEHGIGRGSQAPNLGVVRLKTHTAAPDTTTVATNTWYNGLVTMFHN